MATRTFTHLRHAVAGYMNRDTESLVWGGFNCLDQAINDAHQWVQRMHIFERASMEVTVPDVSLENGASLSTAVRRGTTDPVLVRALRAAWLPSVNGGELPVNIVRRETWVARRKRMNDSVLSVTDVPSDTITGITLPVEVVLHGEIIHLSSANPAILNNATTTDIHFDAIEWLPDYEEPDDTDLFVTYLFDLMVLRSVHYLNFFLKEDQRVSISQSAWNEVWESALRWDSSLAHNSSPVTLD